MDRVAALPVDRGSHVSNAAIGDHGRVSGDVVWMPGGVRTKIHLDAERTAGSLCLLVDEPPAGWSLPAHRHLGESETIHVVEGEFAMDLAGERSLLRPGETIHVPAGVVHGGGNVGTQTGRRLVLFHPAGVERFFREVGTSSPSEPLDVSAVMASAARPRLGVRVPRRPGRRGRRRARNPLRAGLGDRRGSRPVAGRLRPRAGPQGRPPRLALNESIRGRRSRMPAPRG